MRSRSDDVAEEAAPRGIRPWAEIVGGPTASTAPVRPPRRRSTRPLPPIWVAKLNGERVVLVPVAELAVALNRRPRTIRDWEGRRILPPAPYRSPSADYRGRRRLYSPAHIDGIVRLAADEGILYGKPADISKTHFPERVRRLYHQLAAEATQPLPPGQRSA